MPRRRLTSEDPQWHLERLKGLGGSDIDDLANAEPYGCMIRLYNEKTQKPKDLEESFGRPAARGKRLEPVALSIFLDQQERPGARRVPAHYLARAKTVEVLRPHMEEVEEIPLPDEVVGNIDFAIEAPGDAPWLPKMDLSRWLTKDGMIRFPLECKTCNEHVWWKDWNEGLPEAYYFQPSHYLMMTGAPFCPLILYWPDGDRWSINWIMREPSLFSDLVHIEKAFWDHVKARECPSGDLKPHMTTERCGKCPWRISCLPEYFTPHGVPKTGLPSLDHIAEAVRLKKEYDQLEADAENKKDRMKEIEARVAIIIEENGDFEKVVIDGRPVSYLKTTRNKTDYDEIRMMFPEETKQFTTRVPWRELRFGTQRS